MIKHGLSTVVRLRPKTSGEKVTYSDIPTGLPEWLPHFGLSGLSGRRSGYERCIDHHIGRGADLSTIVNVKPLAILEAEEQIID